MYYKNKIYIYNIAKKMETIYVYSTYTPAVKECIKRYREKNKEKINEKNMEYYKMKMENPEHKQKLRDQARLRYQRKKEKERNELINVNQLANIIVG